LPLADPRWAIQIKPLAWLQSERDIGRNLRAPSILRDKRIERLQRRTRSKSGK
jgi:hypothetical protein